MSKGKDLINSIKYGLYRMLTMQQPAPSQYATVQEAAMYNFDKDYEDDRELLREDPYAEYPDFPKECRMTDMAQMDMVYC